MGCVPSVPRYDNNFDSSSTDHIAKKPRPLTENGSKNSGIKKRNSKKGNVSVNMLSYEEELLRKEREKEKILNEILAAEKNDLRNKALPMIERRLSCENLLEEGESIDVLGARSTRNNNTNSEHMTVTTMQRQMRRKQAKLLADIESKWMLFNNMDAFEDSDLFALSTFMQTVIKNVPKLKQNAIRTKSYQELNIPNEEEDGIIVSRENSRDNLNTLNRRHSSYLSGGMGTNTGSTNDLSGIITISRSSSTRGNSSNNITAVRENSVESFMRLNKLSLGSQNPQEMSGGNSSSSPKGASSGGLIPCLVNDSITPEYDLPSGIITMNTATQIIALFKAGGKLSTKAVHKILRLAYRKVKKLSNTSRVIIGPTDKLTVVGDIHGQLPDLVHILEESGFPSHHHKYVFNGDFVDRGPQGVEVMCVLLSLYAAMPGQVFLNRGNHEDFAICCAYGFQTECLDKYDDITFGMFIEIFNYLPLFAVVNDSVFIVHGGLFHATDATLQELNEINRCDFSLSDLPEGGEQLEHFPRAARHDFLKQLQRDALWSDPQETEGLGLNPRGAGVAFGPDVTKKFLDINNLKLIVRSHECIRSGFSRTFQDEYENMLCTIFSASNYGGGGNSAAYMVFTTQGSRQTRSIANSMLTKVQDSGLVYSVYYFHVDEQSVFDSSMIEYQRFLHSNNGNGTGVDSVNEAHTAVTDADHQTGGGNSLMFADLIIRKKSAILAAFLAADTNGKGYVSKTIWSDVMYHSTKLHIRWAALVPVLVKDSCLVIVVNSDEGVLHDKNNGHSEQMVKYREFLGSFSHQESFNISPTVLHGDDIGLLVAGEAHDDEESDIEDYNSMMERAIIEALYSRAKELEVVFQFFDTDNDGIISRDEFSQGCEMLNAVLSPQDRLKDYLHVLDIMDVTETGKVDINLFFEMFRLSDNNTAHTSAAIITLTTSASTEETPTAVTSPTALVPPPSIGQRRRSFSVEKLFVPSTETAGADADDRDIATTSDETNRTSFRLSEDKTWMSSFGEQMGSTGISKSNTNIGGVNTLGSSGIGKRLSSKNFTYHDLMEVEGGGGGGGNNNNNTSSNEQQLQVYTPRPVIGRTVSFSDGVPTLARQPASTGGGRDSFNIQQQSSVDINGVAISVETPISIVTSPHIEQFDI